MGQIHHNPRKAARAVTTSRTPIRFKRHNPLPDKVLRRIDESFDRSTFTTERNLPLKWQCSSSLAKHGRPAAT
jgi:hypothetical protein